jgi:hypothetical protein
MISKEIKKGVNVIHNVTKQRMYVDCILPGEKAVCSWREAKKLKSDIFNVIDLKWTAPLHGVIRLVHKH